MASKNSRGYWVKEILRIFPRSELIGWDARPARKYTSGFEMWFEEGGDKKMGDIGDLFPRKYLSHTDLPLGGLEVTINRVDKAEMKSEDGVNVEKAVLYFEEVDQGLVLNVTNGSKIASIHGRDYETWGGRKIRLVVDDGVLFKGRLTKAIRVREIV